MFKYVETGTDVEITFKDIMDYIRIEATEEERLEIMEELDAVYIDEANTNTLEISTVQDELKFEWLRKHLSDITLEQLETLIK